MLEVTRHWGVKSAYKQKLYILVEAQLWEKRKKHGKNQTYSQNKRQLFSTFKAYVHIPCIHRHILTYNFLRFAFLFCRLFEVVIKILILISYLLEFDVNKIYIFPSFMMVKSLFIYTYLYVNMKEIQVWSSYSYMNKRKKRVIYLHYENKRATTTQH